MLRLLTSGRPIKTPGKSATPVSRFAVSGAVFVAMGLLTLSGATAADSAIAPAGQNAPPLVIVSPNRLLAGPDASQSRPGPGEPVYPLFKLDWSLGLRGSYKNGTNGAFYSATIAPQISLTQTGLRSQYVLGAQADLAYNQERITRIKQGQISASGQYALDQVTQLSGSGALALSQDDPNAPGMDQIITTPLVLDLNAQAGIARRFSRLTVKLTGNASRQAMSETVLAGNVVQDNIASNNTKLGASLRASYKLTPIISAFTQGDISRDWFDAPAPNSGLYQNGRDLKGAIGLIGNWRDVLGAQISVGYGLRRFDDASIPDIANVLYALDLSYSPNKTLSAGASFSTTINPEDSQNGLPASVSYTAKGNIDFSLTPTLRLRSSASGNWVVPVNAEATKITYSAGAGAELTVNRQTNISVDYLYSKALRPPAAPQDQQAVTMGLTFSR